MGNKIRSKLIRDAYGIVLLTECKAGLTVGAKMGTGIIIVRLDNDSGSEWSAPIAVGTGGFSFGLQGGISKVDHIVFLPSPNHVRTFLGKGQFSVKGNAEAAVVSVGRDANVGVAVNDKMDAAPIMSYSFGVKGLYAGITLDVGGLFPRHECNANYYGYKVDLEQIANGQVNMKDKQSKDYERILFSLNNSIGHQLGVHNVDNDVNAAYTPPSLPIEKDEEEGKEKYSIYENN